MFICCRPGKRYQATLHLSSSSGALSSGSDHGLTLELGVYVAKIQPGSVAAKEGVIAIGDRIVSVSWNDWIIWQKQHMLSNWLHETTLCQVQQFQMFIFNKFSYDSCTERKKIIQNLRFLNPVKKCQKFILQMTAIKCNLAVS